jgi:hypothetical protein
MMMPNPGDTSSTVAPLFVKNSDVVILQDKARDINLWMGSNNEKQDGDYFPMWTGRVWLDDASVADRTL